MSDLRPGITAVIACHPIRMRNGFLLRALKSVCGQLLQPDAIHVVNDTGKRGAGWTRRIALEHIGTEWFAWLDSDDYWYPNHLQELAAQLQDKDVRYVFSWFDGQHDPLGHFGKPFDVAAPHHTTITALVNTELAREVGYPDSDLSGPFSGEDWALISGMAALCNERGLKMVHVPKRTWFWDQSGQNTSGLPNKGDAA